MDILPCKINLYNIEDNLLSQFIISYQYPITLFLILIDNGTRPKSEYSITDDVLCFTLRIRFKKSV